MLTPFAYHPFRVCVSLSPLSEQLTHVDVAEVDSHRAVDEAVDHGVGLEDAAA